LEGQRRAVLVSPRGAVLARTAFPGPYRADSFGPPESVVGQRSAARVSKVAFDRTKARTPADEVFVLTPRTNRARLVLRRAIAPSSYGCGGGVILAWHGRFVLYVRQPPARVDVIDTSDPGRVVDLTSLATRIHRAFGGGRLQITWG
jgi:hypothetical protein